MKFTSAFSSLFIAAVSSLATAQQTVIPPAHITKAIAVLTGDATGFITFEQPNYPGPVKVIGEVSGLNASTTHGFHVHQYGNLTAGCASTGAHFNPYNVSHGAPTDLVRHVGDLGNIETGDSGSASISLIDGYISLNGPLSILGRGVVIHAGTDDLGKGNNTDSAATGNAGGRTACGIIAIAA